MSPANMLVSESLTDRQTVGSKIVKGSFYVLPANMSVSERLKDRQTVGSTMEKGSLCVTCQCVSQ